MWRAARALHAGIGAPEVHLPKVRYPVDAVGVARYPYRWLDGRLLEPLTAHRLPGRRVQARVLEIVFPTDTNHLGTIFGGTLVAWMDKAAAFAAVRRAHTFDRQTTPPVGLRQ